MERVPFTAEFPVWPGWGGVPGFAILCRVCGRRIFFPADPIQKKQISKRVTNAGASATAGNIYLDSCPTLRHPAIVMLWRSVSFSWPFYESCNCGGLDTRSAERQDISDQLPARLTQRNLHVVRRFFTPGSRRQKLQALIAVEDP